MNRCVVVAIAAAVLSQVFAFVVHGLLLGNDYAALPSLFRQPGDQQGTFAFMILAHVFYGVAFAWIYLQGKKPGLPALGQGLRYGLAVAALVTVPMYLIYYAVQPMPPMLVAKQIVFEGIATVLLGVIVAYLSREPGEALVQC